MEAAGDERVVEHHSITEVVVGISSQALVAVIFTVQDSYEPQTQQLFISGAVRYRVPLLPVNNF